MAYRHCRACGWGYRSREEWEAGRYCSNCGKSLCSVPRREDSWIEEPTPCAVPPSALTMTNASLRKLAVEHPLIFGTCTAGFGAGALLLAPQFLTIGQTVALLGSVLLCIGMVSTVLAEDKEQGARLAAAGVMVMLAGAGIALAGALLATTGIVAVAGGSGVVLKAGAAEVLRWRLNRKMKEKSLTELLAIARQLN